MIHDRVAAASPARMNQPLRASHDASSSKSAAAAAGGLMLSLRLPFAKGEGARQMGQGIYTAISMLIAEELEVGLDQVRVEHAPPNPKLYGNPFLAGVQATGGSTAIRATWKPLREAGAVARTMLMSAAAKRWNVDPARREALGLAPGRGQPGETGGFDGGGRA
jgi:isoquinoline 1-oxidoreductase beta subunit